MALRKLVKRNHGVKWPLSIKYQNLHTFKKGIILLCQSVFETRRTSHLDGSVLFTIPLKSSANFANVFRGTYGSPRVAASIS